jgi:hypothetical protein
VFVGERGTYGGVPFFVSESILDTDRAKLVAKAATRTDTLSWISPPAEEESEGIDGDGRDQDRDEKFPGGKGSDEHASEDAGD